MCRGLPAGVVRHGAGQPAELLVAPAVEHGQVYAVIELGFYRPVTETERRCWSAPGTAGGGHPLWHRPQPPAERCWKKPSASPKSCRRSRSELSNEELEQQSRIPQESQAQMEVQQTELEQTNAHLEAQTQQLEYQREQLLRAQSAMTDKARELGWPASTRASSWPT